MDWLHTIGAVAGCLALLAVVLGLALLVLCAARDATFARSDSRRQEARENERADLRAASWWFTEDPLTHNLLADLSSGVPVEKARETWRRARGRGQDIPIILPPVPR